MALITSADVRAAEEESTCGAQFGLRPGHGGLDCQPLGQSAPGTRGGLCVRRDRERLRAPALPSPPRQRAGRRGPGSVRARPLPLRSARPDAGGRRGPHVQGPGPRRQHPAGGAPGRAHLQHTRPEKDVEVIGEVSAELQSGARGSGNFLRVGPAPRSWVAADLATRHRAPRNLSEPLGKVALAAATVGASPRNAAPGLPRPAPRAARPRAKRSLPAWLPPRPPSCPGPARVRTPHLTPRRYG